VKELNLSFVVIEDNYMAVYFNIASLFGLQDETVIPE
jgi:hypothetical protein